ncbi:glycosyltransferase family 4 protein [Pilimelia columellifera]
MLVDNAVEGDSRVQKTARSAAAAGWAVTLLGRADSVARSWRVGEAKVRLLPMGGAGGASVGRRGRERLRRSRLVGLLRRPVDLALVRFWRWRLGDGAWRRLEPSLWEFEAAYGPAIDALAPDIIHAHDFRMLGVGARAVLRARASGRAAKLVWDAHEFLPGIQPWRDHARWLPAHRGHEREYARHADAVVTVSPELARLLQREHHLPRLPSVVLNAPDIAPGVPITLDGGPDTLRVRCGLGPGVPLLVYSGACAPARGLALAVRALPRLPGAHLALVVNQPDGPHARELVALARQLGVADRLRLLDYVPADRVAAALADADAGIIPIQRWPNHEIALITKFFEYAHARLPIVVSDVRVMAATVRDTGQGEVFRADDLDDYVRAVRAVLGDPARYRAAYARAGLLDGWGWSAQARVLNELYTRLTNDTVDLV